jgi:hypothetical protein
VRFIGDTNETDLGKGEVQGNISTKLCHRFISLELANTVIRKSPFGEASKETIGRSKTRLAISEFYATSKIFKVESSEDENTYLLSCEKQASNSV